jgi:hypothetical protein
MTLKKFLWRTLHPTQSSKTMCPGAHVHTDHLGMVVRLSRSLWGLLACISDQCPSDVILLVHKTYVEWLLRFVLYVSLLKEPRDYLLINPIVFA